MQTTQTTVTAFKAVNVNVSSSNYFIKDSQTPIEPTGAFNIPNECEVTLTDKDGVTTTKRLRYYKNCPTIDKDEQITKYKVSENRPYTIGVDDIWFQNHSKYVNPVTDKQLHDYLVQAQPAFANLYAILDYAKKEEAELDKIEELDSVYTLIRKLASENNKEMLRKAAEQLGIDPNKGNAGIVLEMRKKAAMKDDAGNYIGIQRVRTVIEGFEDSILVTIDEALKMGLINEGEMVYTYNTGEKLKAFVAKETNSSKNRNRLAAWLRSDVGGIQLGIIKDMITKAKAEVLVTN